MNDYRLALEVATQAAIEAGAILRAEVSRPDGPRGPLHKCPADDEAEHLIRARLVAEFPDWGYLGEETGERKAAPGERHIWLVDPNDGTRAMQDGHRGAAVSIGLIFEGQPMLGVVYAYDAPDDGGDLIAWAEGQGPPRRNGVAVPSAHWPAALGRQELVIVSQAADARVVGNAAACAPARFRSVASIAYRLALIAVGEGAVGVGLSGACCWDYAGGHALLRGSGGVLLEQGGREVNYDERGWSLTRWCFGGAPGPAAELARHDWSRVTEGRFGAASPHPGMEPARLRPGAHIHDSEVLRRAQGCLLGQLSGDSLGSLVEFQSASAIARSYPGGGPSALADGGPFQLQAGQPTDDSELALALARALLAASGFDREAVARAYTTWYQGWPADPDQRAESWFRPFDSGSTTARALSEPTRADVANRSVASTAAEAAGWSSQANGALMRVSPLGIFGWRASESALAEWAREDASLTHPHPNCGDASALFCLMLARAIREGPTPAQLYAWAQEWCVEHRLQPEIRAAVQHAAEAAPSDFMTNQGWVLLALQNALYQLVHAPTLEAGVIDTVRRGGDTDTNAAICGALLGAVHGRPAIPDQWRKMVLSCRALPGGAGVQRPRPATYWANDALVLAERLLLAGA